MRDVLLILFALFALGEGIHITAGYLRTLKGLAPWRSSRFLHWFFALSLLVLWLAWNRFRVLP
ncbi:MAG: hypothetical protein J6M34_06125 [Clostridia bacterium]|nr:hypothetical protein [Clostridia bacterium]